MYSTTEETNVGKLEGVGSTDHYHNSRLDDPDDKQVCVGVVWVCGGCKEIITTVIVIVWHRAVCIVWTVE